MYIITFNNKLYYYIGSTTNFKKRINKHNLNIKEYIKALENNDYKARKENSLNDMIKFYLDSILLQRITSKSKIDYSFDNQKLNALRLNIRILYLNTNYLNLFRSIYPKYKLDKGEKILLSKITEILIKWLESSLIYNFQPKLNIAEKALFKHIEWNDELLDISNRNDKIPEYLKTTLDKKYKIYIVITTEKPFELDSIPNDFLSNKITQYFINNIEDYLPLTYDDHEEKLIYVSTFQDISFKFNLREYEVLSNLNRYHQYKGTLLKNPLKLKKFRRI